MTLYLQLNVFLKKTNNKNTIHKIFNAEKKINENLTGKQHVSTH